MFLNCSASPCEADGRWLRTPSVDDEPLQRLAKGAGISQRQLAQLLGVTDSTVSQQLRGKWASGTPRYVISVLIAWQNLPHEKRIKWLEEVEAVERDLKRRGG